MVLRSKKKKNTKATKPSPKAQSGKPSTKLKKKKRAKKNNVEVTSITEDVLEDSEDLDQAYKDLRTRVLAHLKDVGLTLCCLIKAK